ncbi:MAG: AAA family ATPase [Arcobacteraceae bacterium]|nr:AAA family ATPase [Arcobacteraceae bacterium]
MRDKNIILIGFMGVGKGTIARAIVAQSNYFAIDTDDLIESLENTKIKKIFAKEGEPYFRDLEKKCALWCEKNLQGTIISTGGGFYRQENIHKIGTVIYLKASFESIIKRLENAPNSKAKFKKRPLLQDLDKAKDIYNQRVKEYESVADIVIDVDDFDAQKAVKNILKAI